MALVMMGVFVMGNAAGVMLLRQNLQLWMVAAGVLVIPILATGLAMKMERIVLHVPRGHFCDGCGYNLSGNTSEKCPECGREFTIPRAIVVTQPVNSGPNVDCDTSAA